MKTLWSRTILLFSLWGTVLLLAVSAGAQDPSSVETQRNDYEVALKKIGDTCAASLRTHLDQYGNSLATLARQLQADGELAPLLAVKQEKERFDAERAIPEEAPEGASSHIVKFQEDYRKAATKASIKRSRDITELTDRYVAGLEALKRDCTKRDKLEDAIAMKGEIERVQSSAPVTEAQFALAESGITSRSMPGTIPRARMVVCPSCAGEGKIDGASSPCVRCLDALRKGLATKAGASLAAAGKGKCASCRGTGQRKSGFKGVSDTIGCVGCSASGVCRFCKGTGSVTEKAVCGQCNGTGKIPAPAPDNQ